MSFFKLRLNEQNGSIPLLLLLPILGAIILLILTSVLDFKNQSFKDLFQKQFSKAAGETTTISPMSLAATYESISVYTPFSNDTNSNNKATLEYRKIGDSSWKQGMAMTVDRRATVTGGSNTYPNPYVNQWRASILGLMPNTQYEVMVTFDDIDGISGTNPLTQTIFTRDENIVTGGATYYVATNGNDNNPGTLAQPFLTIQKGVNILQAGDKLLIRGGTYNEQVTIGGSISGTVNNWISIESYPGEQAIIDGQNTKANNIYIGTWDNPAVAKYFRFKGLKLINAAQMSMQINGQASDIIVDGNIMEGFVDMAMYMGFYDTPNTPTANIVIQNNTITRTKLPDPIRGGQNIGFYSTAGGHVVRNNIIQDTTGAQTNARGGGDHTDCIGGGPDFNMDTGLYRDSDVYNNTILDCNDDAIQADGAGMNVRVWGNTLKGVATNGSGISVAPIIVGPIYVFRNLSTGQFLNGVKFGQNTTGAMYIYNNTFYTNNAGADGFFQTDAGLSNLTTKNNIIHAGRYMLELVTPDTISNKFDYNAMFTSDPSRSILWQNANKTYNQFRTESGNETHGFNVNATNQFKNAEGGDFQLVANSQFVDSGDEIKGFNDQDSAWAYQGSSPDIGAFEAEGAIPAPNPSTAPATKTAEFSLSPVTITIQKDQEFPLKVMAKSDIDAANLFSAKLNFDAAKLEVVRIDDAASFVNQWLEKVFDNVQGKVSIIGGVTPPGLKTTSTSAELATVIFKAKQAGTLSVAFDNAQSEILRNSDSQNIFNTSAGTTITATNPPPSPTPLPSVIPSPTVTPAPTASPSPTAPPVQVACTLTSAAWKMKINPVIAGTVVNLIINSSGNCNGKQVVLEVKEDDGIFGNDRVSRQVLPVTFGILPTVTAAWIAEYQVDGFNGIGDPPEYFFVARLADNSSSVTSANPELQVNKSTGTVIKRGDVNSDGQVNLTDMSIIIANWFKTVDYPDQADVNEDGIINTFDFSGMIQLLKLEGVLSNTL